MPPVSTLLRNERLQQVGESLLLGASSRLPLGTNVFTRDWDLLVILDCCRYDALSLMEAEFDCVNDVASMWSVGSSTREWTANTYTEEFRDVIERTAVVSANVRVTWTLEAGHALESPFAGRFTSWDIVGPEDFLVYDSLPDYAPVDPFGGVLTPDIVTDRAIRVGRTFEPDRLVVHYVPPHKPYRANVLRENRDMEPYEYRPFAYLQDGGDRDVVVEAYLDELRWVLSDVAVLLENVDAERAVVSADHGELFGDLGLHGHPTGVPHPRLRRVPWMETTATDTGRYEPHFEKQDRERRDSERLAENHLSHLEHLGYR